MFYLLNASVIKMRNRWNRKTNAKSLKFWFRCEDFRNLIKYDFNFENHFANFFLKKIHEQTCIKWLFCKFEMSKSYVDSKISRLKLFKSCKSTKNKIFLYAKRTNILKVLIFIDMLEIFDYFVCAFCNYLKILIVIKCQKTKRFCMQIWQISQQRFVDFLIRYVSTFINF